MSALEKGLFSSFAIFLIGLFVSLVLSFISSLYILDINSSSDIWANTFSHYVGCFFYFVDVFLAVQNSVW